MHLLLNVIGSMINPMVCSYFTSLTCRINYSTSLLEFKSQFVRDTDIYVDIDTLFYMVNTGVCLAMPLVYKYPTAKIKAETKIQK